MSNKKKQKDQWKKIGSFNELDSQKVKSDRPQKYEGTSNRKKEEDKRSSRGAGSNMRANIGWLFSKDYYRGIEKIKARLNEIKNQPGREKDQLEKELYEHFERKNNDIVNKRLSYYTGELNNLKLPDKLENLVEFELTTIYPGLFTGSGMPHETHSKGEFTLGFFFDHTTGLPIIPGSSVKGVLRSTFQHPEYIIFLLKKITGNDYSKDDIKEIERQIFRGEKKSKEKEKNGNTKYKPIPFKERDIFFDAVIAPTSEKCGNFLGIDFITPHKNDEFKDPVPLQFLKVLPGVTFLFQFILRDGNGKIKKEEKLALFKRILLDLGIGAKTNVGYGKFEKEE